MRVIKKIPAFLLMLVLCIGMMSMHAFAASSTQDGLEVTLTTDKEEYSQVEEIIATITVTNTNDVVVTNLSLEGLIPDGYKLAEGTEATKQVETLGAGETLTLIVTYVQDVADEIETETSNEKETEAESVESAEDNDSESIANNSETQDNSSKTSTETNATIPRTGDNSKVKIFSILMIVALFSLLVLIMCKRKHKNCVKILSVFIGVLLTMSIFSGVFNKVYAAENHKTIAVSKTVSVDGMYVTVKAEVTYEINDSNFEDMDKIDWGLGEDINTDISFTPQEPTPTFDSVEKEVANIANINGGTVPYSDYDDNGVPNFIDGKFSNKIVKSADDAIDSLNDIHYIMGFENANQEFKEVYSETVHLGKDTSFYRLQQYYHNIPVYGYQLIVSTDENGEIQTLSGHYCPDIKINTRFLISMQDAKNIIKNIYNNSEIRSEGLYIYIDDSNQTILIWKIETIEKDYFVNAINGDIVYTEYNICDSEHGNGNDMSGAEVSFPVFYASDSDCYYMWDSDKRIYIFDSKHTNVFGQLISDKTNNSDNWSLYPEAISAYNNVIKTYNYYSNILGRTGADNKRKPVWIDVNYRTDNNRPLKNAYFTEAYKDKTVLLIGDYTNYAQSLDVIAHEYTHAINDAIWSPVYENESGALDEAYADILGELIENGKLEYIGEDLISGTLRSFSNPEEYNQPSNYKDKYNIDSDNGGVHYNSGIINYAAFLMDQNWPTENHAEELATLFYKSMYYMASSTPNSNFSDCRHALLAASKSMNMSYEKRKVIANALEDVGVNGDEEAWASAHHIIGVVKDAETDKPIIDAQVIAVATHGLGGGIGYTNGTGNYDVRVNLATYKVSVFADGYRAYTVENINLAHLFNMNYYMETIYLTPAEWSDDTQNVFAAGKVINALTGEGLEGATVKFRNGSNNKNGAYVQTVAGLDIELVTDGTGQYYTAALPAGNYTLEASKEGFITGYINIVSGNSEMCSNQNITLTPELNKETIRIVLTWGRYPDDLDSHVEGILSNNDTFHVSFEEMSQYDGDFEVCNLDVDDITSYGPETITLNVNNSLPYYYYIHNFSGNGSIADSNAQVKVYQGENLIGTFNVPTDQGDEIYWNVFAIKNGEIIAKNTITSNADTSYALSN